jgi:peptide deformylase
MVCVSRAAAKLAVWPVRPMPFRRAARHKNPFDAMALLNILHYPDKRLHKVAKPVAEVDNRIRKLVADMAETMYKAPGVGLAATQVDVHERVIVIDVSETHDQLLTFINPEIVWSSNEKKLSEEGCLSVPGIYDNVERADKVRVRALNEKGEPFELDCEGLLAVCIQHEMDHLMGRVFVEYLSPLKQTRIKSKMKKLERAM